MIGVARYQSRPFEQLGRGSSNRVRLADAEEPILMPVLEIDEAFVPVMKMDVLAGRNVAGGLGPEHLEVLVSESALSAFGVADPIGVLGLPIDLGWRGSGTVVGVVRDFHWESLHRAIGPTVLKTPRWVNFPGEKKLYHYYSNVAVRFKPGRVRQGLDEVAEVWHQFTKDYPFAYQFLDEIFSRQYRNEAKLSQLIGSFAGLAVFVAVLGVFALAAFTVHQRTKEIGVRKVLGATMARILLLLFGDFGRLFLVGAVVAWPMAYWAMTSWLEGFAYHVEPRLFLFLASTALVLIIAALAVMQQVLRAARSNPVDALRYE